MALRRYYMKAGCPALTVRWHEKAACNTHSQCTEQLALELHRCFSIYFGAFLKAFSYSGKLALGWLLLEFWFFLSFTWRSFAVRRNKSFNDGLQKGFPVLPRPGTVSNFVVSGIQLFIRTSWVLVHSLYYMAFYKCLISVPDIAEIMLLIFCMFRVLVRFVAFYIGL